MSKNKITFGAGFVMLALILVSCTPVKKNASASCGISLRDTQEPFTIFEKGSVAQQVSVGADGSVSWVATAAGGAGGGVAFYVKSDMSEINIANYESIELELDYEPVAGKWNSKAKNPGFCMRILPWDSTGLFGGFEDLEYFDSDALSGTYKHTIKIPADFAQRVISSSDQDAVMAFAIKFNDYQRGNSDGDQLKVTLKSVKFNAKAGAPADKPFDDGLTANQRGSVVEINYPTRDYSVAEANVKDSDRYNKHA